MVLESAGRLDANGPVDDTLPTDSPTAPNNPLPVDNQTFSSDGGDEPPVMGEPQDTLLYLVITGQGQVGKSTVIFRYADEAFNRNLTTTYGRGCAEKHDVQLGAGKSRDIRFTDMEGQNNRMVDPVTNKEIMVRELFFTSEHRGVALMFALNEYESFLNAIAINDGDAFKGYLGEVLENFKVKLESLPVDQGLGFTQHQPGEYAVVPPMVFIGNKNDLRLDGEFGIGRERVVNHIERIRTFFSSNQNQMLSTLAPVDYIETSAMNGTNVYSALTLLAKKAQVYESWLEFYKVKGTVFKSDGTLNPDLSPAPEVIKAGKECIAMRDSYIDFIKEMEFISTRMSSFVSQVQDGVRSVMDEAVRTYDALDDSEKPAYVEAVKSTLSGYLADSYAGFTSWIEGSPASLDVQAVQASLPEHIERFSTRAVEFLAGERTFMANHVYTVEVLPPYLRNRYLSMDSFYDIAGVVSPECRGLALVCKDVKIKEEDTRLSAFNLCTENLRASIADLESKYSAPPTQ